MQPLEVKLLAALCLAIQELDDAASQGGIGKFPATIIKEVGETMGVHIDKPTEEYLTQQLCRHDRWQQAGQ